MAREVRNVSTFQTPIHATLKGRPTRILAIGDQEGKSPVYLTVDENGQSVWESVSEFRIIDHNALPLSQQALDASREMAGETTSRR